jgi:hypothetical protein
MRTLLIIWAITIIPVAIAMGRWLRRKSLPDTATHDLPFSDEGWDQ